MMRRLLVPFLFAAFSGAPVFAWAQSPNLTHDSLYYMMDDGKQSHEEMEEEALYVHQFCQNNPYESRYFDCDCIGGAFLQQREKLGPMVPQQDIVSGLLKSRNAQCANTVNIAGQAYRDCLKFAEMSRELANDNEEYCSCAANKSARDFTRAPRLNGRYIRMVYSNALSYCRDPANRPAAPAKKSSLPATDAR